MFTLLKFRLVFYKPILLIDELQQKKPRIYQETKHAHFLQQKKHIFLAFQSSFIFISFQKSTLCDIIVMNINTITQEIHKWRNDFIFFLFSYKTLKLSSNLFMLSLFSSDFLYNEIALEIIAMFQFFPASATHVTNSFFSISNVLTNYSHFKCISAL